MDKTAPATVSLAKPYQAPQQVPQQAPQQIPYQIPQQTPKDRHMALLINAANASNAFIQAQAAGVSEADLEAYRSVSNQANCMLMQHAETHGYT